MAEQQDRTNPNARTASLLLSFVAGYVDSCTFLGLFGLFVAQVTGSFVAAGAQMARGEHAFASVMEAVLPPGLALALSIGIALATPSATAGSLIRDADIAKTNAAAPRIQPSRTK